MGKRERAFAGYERRVPLDRNAKARIKLVAGGMRKMRKITGTAYEILIELLYHFHNSKSGTCFPTYEQLAKQSGRHRSTPSRRCMLQISRIMQ